ncbi:recombinase family protein [Chloroflexota bacterium]
MNQRRRALIYIRKSMVRNRRDEISPERQLSNCMAVAESHGWLVDEGDIYQDAEGHRSGRSEVHRPAWRALKTRVITDPSVAAVIVNSLDRSSRSPKDFFSFLDLIQTHEVELVSVTEQFDTSSAIGKAFLAILMVIASLESDLASERTSSTIDYLKSQGIHWGFTPYGYDRDDDTILVPNDDAPAVVRCCELYAQGSLSYLKVARKLNAEGYRWRDKQGQPAPFSRYAVRSILSNILIYAGWVPVGRGKDMQINDEAKTIAELAFVTDAVQGQHEPIIKDELANRVLATRHKRKALGVRRDDYVYLLTPVLHCATCGQPLRGKVGRRSGYTYCHRTRGKGCHHADGTFGAEALEGEVLQGLDLKLPPMTIAAIRDSVESRMRSRPENSAIQDTIDALKKKRQRLRELYLMGEYEKDDYLLLRSDIMRELQGLERKLTGSDYPVESVLTRLDKLSDVLERGKRGQQKKVLGMLFESVSIDGEGTIKEVELQKWARPLFADLLIVNGDHKCPQGTSNARHVATLAGLEVAQARATAASEHDQTDSTADSVTG